MVMFFCTLLAFTAYESMSMLSIELDRHLILHKDSFKSLCTSAQYKKRIYQIYQFESHPILADGLQYYVDLLTNNGVDQHKAALFERYFIKHAEKNFYYILEKTN